MVYTLKPSSLDEKQICVDRAPDPSLPGEKTLPRRQSDGSRATPTAALTGTRRGASLSARLREGGGRPQKTELLFPGAVF